MEDVWFIAALRHDDETDIRAGREAGCGRTESRWGFRHLRSDYPDTDDPNWQ